MEDDEPKVADGERVTPRALTAADAGAAAAEDDTTRRPTRGTPTLSRLGKLCLAFARVGVFGFGGGPSMIPLVKREATGDGGWLRDDEFMELYAVASSLPGPIATNTAGYLGWRLAGPLGSIVALLALTLPSGIAIVALGGLYLATKDSKVTQDALAGVRPVVIALLVGVAVSFAPSALAGAAGRPGRIMRWTAVVIAFVAAVMAPVHPAVIIALGAIAGLLLRRRW